MPLNGYKLERNFAMALAVEKKQVAEEKKPIRFFKGDVVKAEDLKNGDPIQIMKKKDLRYTKNQFGIFNRIVNSLNKTNADVEYLDVDKLNYVFATVNRSESSIKILKGKKGKDLLKQFQDSQKDKIPQYRTPLTIGADPEIFAVDSDGNVIPAWLYLKSKGNSSNPLSPPYARNNIYWDGYQGEFDLKPQTCLAYFTDHIQTGLAAIHHAAKNYDKNAKLSNLSVVPVDMKEMKNFDDKYVQFGCMPSSNVYGISGNGENGRKVRYRFAGGHLHFGFDKSFHRKEIIERVVKSLDAITGVACVSLFAEFDNPIRREYYGLAGEYRTPSHGIEYRALSNAWLMHPLLCHMVYELARWALTIGVNNYNCWEATEEETIRAIQECNVDLSRKILDRNKKIFVKIMNQINPRYIDGEIMYNLYFNGADKFIKNPSDIDGNWSLTNYTNWAGHSSNPNACIINAINKLKKAEKV